MSSSNANGISVAYTYDNLNRLSIVVDSRLPAGQNTTTYSYDQASNLATVTYPNGVQSSFTYDDLDRATTVTLSQRSPVAGYNYTFGSAGNRLSAAEQSGRAVNWAYDGIYRLTSEAISLDPHAKNGTIGYGFDPVGNRLTETSTLSGIASGTFSYDANDRLSAETYDTNGNVLAFGAKTFTYDSENRLKSANSGAISLVYDGDGNRVAKTVNGVTTRYLVDAMNLTGYAQVVEEIVNGGVARTYTYGLQRINQSQFIGTTWTPSFYGYDDLDSVRLLADATGAVTDQYDYDAWGNAINTVGSTPNVYLYRGEQYDTDLGLYYLRARYFNPVSGRFLSRDPGQGNAQEPLAQHKYLYAQDDPVDLIDPTGWQAQSSGGFCGMPLTPLAGGYAVMPIGPLLVPQIELPKPPPVKWGPCMGGADPPSPNFGMKGGPNELQDKLRDAIREAADKLRQSCCAGDDSPKIANGIERATFIYKPKLEICGEVGRASVAGIRHQIAIGPLSFGPRCCSLASTIAHEASHMAPTRYGEGKAYALEAPCFGCSGKQPPKAPKAARPTPE